MSKVNIMGVMVDKVTMNEAMDKVMEFLKSDKLNPIYTPNPEFIMNAIKDEEFKTILNKGSLVIPDGIGVVYASKIFKNSVPERVAGYDLIQNMFDKIKDTEYKVYFWGSKEETVKLAIEKMKEKHSGLKIVGYRNGYFKPEDEEGIIQDINNSLADIVLVAQGSPRQEKMIERYKEKLNAKIAIGCGGVLDGMAGVVKRAPVAFQKMGLEWFYRLLKEPKRIGRMMKLPEFMIIAIKEKKKWRKMQ